LNPVDDLHRK